MVSKARVHWHRACVCVCVLVYAPGRTYAAVDYGAGIGGGAAGVCRVKGLQLLIAGWYTDTDTGL